MVEQHAVPLPTYNSYSMPNFPNYRLGAIPPIMPSFSYQAFGDSVLFQNTATGGVEFEWDFGDGNTGTGSEATHLYEQPGVYVVSLTVSQDCLSEVVTDTVVLVFTGVREASKEHFALMPNPASGEITLSLNNPTDQPLAFELFDLNSKTLISSHVPAHVTHFTFDVHQLPCGMYFYKVSEEGNLLFSGRLAVER